LEKSWGPIAYRLVSFARLSLSTMSHTIPASTLFPLQDLQLQPVGTKVRFLGCVRAYDHVNASLTLTFPPKTIPSAEVNISVPLPTLSIGTLRDGHWFNVIGYIAEGGENQRGATRVDAIALWSAGSVTPSKYSEALEGRLNVEREMAAHQPRDTDNDDPVSNG
jgi:hypothetical protein